MSNGSVLRTRSNTQSRLGRVLRWAFLLWLGGTPTTLFGITAIASQGTWREIIIMLTDYQSMILMYCTSALPIGSVIVYLCVVIRPYYPHEWLMVPTIAASVCYIAVQVVLMLRLDLRVDPFAGIAMYSVQVLAALPITAVAVLSFHVARVRWPLRGHHCPFCRYPIDSDAISWRCPECGRVSKRVRTNV